MFIAVRDPRCERGSLYRQGRSEEVGGDHGGLEELRQRPRQPAFPRGILRGNEIAILRASFAFKAPASPAAPVSAMSTLIQAEGVGVNTLFGRGSDVQIAQPYLADLYFSRTAMRLDGIERCIGCPSTGVEIIR